MPSAALIRGASVVYFSLLPRAGDDSALQQIAYFWNSVGSLRGQMEFNASILFCPAEWKSDLNVWAYANDSFDLEGRVKKAFDPGSTFARGRFVGGL